MIVRRNMEFLGITAWLKNKEKDTLGTLDIDFLAIAELLFEVKDFKTEYPILYDIYNYDYCGRSDENVAILADEFTKLAQQSNRKLQQLSLHAVEELHAVKSGLDLWFSHGYKAYDHTIATLIIYTNDDDPQLITDTTGLSPSSTQKIGDHFRYKHGVKSKERKHAVPFSAWYLDSDLLNTDEVEDHIKRLLEMIRPYKETFIGLTQQYTGTKISVGAYFYNSNPGFWFEPQLMKEICEYEATLDLDLYRGDNEESWPFEETLD
jgi:hypothetical protein